MQVNFAKLKEAGVRLAPVATPGQSDEPITAATSIADCSAPTAIVDAVMELVGQMPPGWSVTDICFKGRRLTFEFQPLRERQLVAEMREANKARVRAEEAVAAAERAEAAARSAFNGLMQCGDPTKRTHVNVAGITVET